MRIILYSIPGCIHAKAFKIFLERNKFPHTEIIVDNEETKRELKKISFQDKISVLKVIKNHGIGVFTGFDEHNLNLNIIEHIKRYNTGVSI